MNKIINRLTLLRGLEQNEAISALCEYASAIADGTPAEEKYNDLISAVYSCGAEEHFRAYTEKLMLTDVNAFSLACAGGEKVSEFLKSAFVADAAEIERALSLVADCRNFRLGEHLRFRGLDFGNLTPAAAENFFRANGYGIFIDNRAFTYENGALKPLSSVSPITLDKLKDYEYEKSVIRNNLSDFVGNLPFSNMLLYGDKGTGKSSTVHALFNLFSESGLKIIEIDKKDIVSLIEVKRLVANIPLKFIIFIDDISLEEDDERLSTLKAALEGSVSGAVENVMIIATSNRRHIVKESFSDRQNSVHPSDLLEEQLSLSDRFGLTVMFSSTDKPSYLSIVRQLAADLEMTLPDETLTALAERWAIVKGGRSPRRAKQFIDFAYSCTKSGREIVF